MSKIIIFDAQVFQSTARLRGMGHYSLALIESMFKNKLFLYKKSYILLNKNLSVHEETLSRLKAIAPGAVFIFEDLLTPYTIDDNNFKNIQLENENRVEKIVTDLKNKNSVTDFDFVIPSLFIDQTCVVFPKSGLRILVFYDLIPLQFYSYYSQASHFSNYLIRFKTLYEADLIWTISNTVLNDLKINLGISDSKLINIRGASISRNSKHSLNPSSYADFRFVLMPTGDDFRKNNLNAVKSFELFLKKNNIKDLKLVITSYFDKNIKNELQKISRNIIFTDEISDEILKYLYKKCELLLFISRYEGLGLPILESIDEKKPIVCSLIPSFLEMSPNAFYYCDTDDIEDISNALTDAYRKKDFDDKLKDYVSITNVFNWKKSATEALTSISNYNHKPAKIKKLNIAIFSPAPSSLATPGKFTLLEHAAMMEYFNIDYYFENGVLDYGFSRVDPLAYCSNSFRASSFTKNEYKKYDAIIYHVGNSDFHIDTIRMSLIFPGYSVFHDTNLSSVFANDANFLGLSKVRLDLEDKLNKPGADYISSIANRQIGLIAHSKYAIEKIKTTVSDNSIATNNINLPTLSVDNNKLKTNKIIKIVFAGIIHSTKGIDLIEEITKSKSIKNYAIYVFGINFMSPEEILELKKNKKIVIKTNLSDFEFQEVLSQSDILVNYRNEYHGETSASVLESMRYGVVPIVRKIGWYDELPDDTVMKASSKKEVVALVEKLVNNKEYRESLSKKCKQYIDQNHSYEKYAEDLYSILSRKITNKNSLISNAIKNDLALKKIKKLF